ncbi:MAG: hypothetical protein ACREP9_11150, partial [Candidatus Dormibacteraceae bacterium]
MKMLSRAYALRFTFCISRVTRHASRLTHHVSRIAPPLLRFALFTLTLSLPLSQAQTDDKQATFFMGRVKYSSNDGNDCGGVGQDLMRLVSRVSTLKVQEERKVRLTDPDLYETPFLFMNGHN